MVYTPMYRYPAGFAPQMGGSFLGDVWSKVRGTGMLQGWLVLLVVL